MSLTPGEFAQLDRLFHEAVSLPVSDRAPFVASVRARDASLADRLVAMLAADSAPSHVVDRIVAAGASRLLADDADLIGEQFGTYRLDEVIGRGGMGAVYRATRIDGAFGQTVAIKTIRAGFESRDAVRRFRREREVLARLNHPGIARLLDGGESDSGVPFVVMEYVEGVPLPAYATARRLDVRARLRLFLELCDAVEFVHRSLIVHRDIKPANVLVTTDGRVKLLDFGIAKLADEFEGQGAVTALSERPMTPAYASPEQVLGHPVTMATDVYALGVLLYELLSGARPIRTDSTSAYAVAHEIVNQMPAVPSEAVREGNGDGLPAAPARIARQLRGDLDRIVMVAMRKEPERRYPSVAALAADLRAWLEGRPVTAQPDTWRYRLRKFVGRHPAASAAAVLFVAVVAAFTGVTVYQRGVIGAERDAALLAERRASATAAFLTRVFTTADPRQAGHKDVTAFDLLQGGVTQIERDVSLDPRVRADLLLTLGLALANLEQLGPGIAAMERSVELSTQVYGRDSLETAEGLQRLGDTLREAQRVDEAFARLDEALAIRRRLLSGDSYEIADSYNNLALVAAVTGRYRDADDLQSASIAMHRRLTGDHSEEIAIPFNNLALLKRRQGKLVEARDLAARAHAILETTDDQRSVLWALGTYAGIRRDLGEIRETEPIYRDIVARTAALVGPDSSRALDKERDIAFGRYLLGDYAGAERLYDALEPRVRRSLGPRSQDLGMLLRDRGLIDRDLGRLDSAERRLRAALTTQLSTGSPHHFRIPPMRRELAAVLIDRGRIDEAERELRDALTSLPTADALPHIERARTLIVLARALRLTHRADEARAALDEAARIVAETTGVDSADQGRLLLERAFAAEDAADPAAPALFAHAASLLAPAVPPRQPERVAAETRAGRQQPR